MAWEVHSTGQEQWIKTFWRVILCLSVMHHEATLARRSHTSRGDVDCYKWVEVGGASGGDVDCYKWVEVGGASGGDVDCYKWVEVGGASGGDVDCYKWVEVGGASGGDVDCYKWVEVGGWWACGSSICKHQCLDLDASCNRDTITSAVPQTDHLHATLNWGSN